MIRTRIDPITRILNKLVHNISVLGLAYVSLAMEMCRFCVFCAIFSPGRRGENIPIRGTNVGRKHMLRLDRICISNSSSFDSAEVSCSDAAEADPREPAAKLQFISQIEAVIGLLLNRLKSSSNFKTAAETKKNKYIYKETFCI